MQIELTFAMLITAIHGSQVIPIRTVHSFMKWNMEKKMEIFAEILLMNMNNEHRLLLFLSMHCMVLRFIQQWNIEVFFDSITLNFGEFWVSKKNRIISIYSKTSVETCSLMICLFSFEYAVGHLKSHTHTGTQHRTAFYFRFVVYFRILF